MVSGKKKQLCFHASLGKVRTVSSEHGTKPKPPTVTTQLYPAPTALRFRHILASFFFFSFCRAKQIKSVNGQRRCKKKKKEPPHTSIACLLDFSFKKQNLLHPPYPLLHTPEMPRRRRRRRPRRSPSPTAHSHPQPRFRSRHVAPAQEGQR